MKSPQIAIPALLLTMAMLTVFGPGCGEQAPPTIVSLAVPQWPWGRPCPVSRDSLDLFIEHSYQRTGPLHTVTLGGDFQTLLEEDHRAIMWQLEQREALEKARRAGCSMFQARTDSGHALLGRNFDHKDTDMLVAWCYPDSGFASVGFIPLNQWGFTPGNPFNPDNRFHRRRLRRAATAVIEGMNDVGLTITLASVQPQPVTPDPDKPQRFLIHLVREILDHAGSLEEAIDLAAGYNIFDNGRDIISHHILLADPVAGSAVLEWHHGKMQVIRSGPHPQVLTNKTVWEKSGDDLSGDCGRFRRLWSVVGDEQPLAGWERGMRALKSATQSNHTYMIEGRPWRVSTQWSAVFDMTARQVYLCPAREFAVVYTFNAPQKWSPG